MRLRALRALAPSHRLQLALTAGARNATLLGIRHRQGTLVVGPRTDQVLHDGDIVIILADEDDIAALNASGRLS